MTYQEAKARALQLEAQWRAACAAVDAVAGAERGAMGLTPDHVKARPEWRAARAEQAAAFAAMRRFNGWYLRAYRAEVRAERDAWRAAGGDRAAVPLGI